MDGGWTYSRACVDILLEYQTRFPEVFDFIEESSNVSSDMFHELDLFENDTAPDRVRELTAWLGRTSCLCTFS
jgi:hypothetical protein